MHFLMPLMSKALHKGFAKKFKKRNKHLVLFHLYAFAPDVLWTSSVLLFPSVKTLRFHLPKKPFHIPNHNNVFLPPTSFKALISF